MSLKIKWRDALGNQVDESLDIDPGNSAGKVKETLTSVVNKGLDRSLELTVSTPTGKSASLVVNQEGCRQAYVTSDGGRYVASGSQVYGLLKDPCPDVCLPDPSEIAASFITLDQSDPSRKVVISGDVNGMAIRWIRLNSHRVLGKSDGQGTMLTCQLNDSDSTMYKDGRTADLTGAKGDVFMRLPRFYYHAEDISGETGDVWRIGFSPNKEADDWKEWDGDDLIGVYEAYNDNGKLRSISGTTPSDAISQEESKSYAQANGSGYSLVKFKHHSMMAFLFYALYGDTDSQSICGSGTGDYPKTTGQTDTLGMTDTVAGENGDSGSINFWGLENWWGDIYEWVDNVSINNRVWTITEDDGSTRDVQAGTSNGYISKVSVGESLDMVLTEADASEYTAFCDYYFQLPSDSLVLARSFYGSNTYGGVAYADAYYDASDSPTNIGSRLAFRGAIVEVKSSEEYESMDVSELHHDIIMMDQTQSDPTKIFTMESDGGAVQWIRNNSHRVLGKRTADGEMTVCRLDDSDSTKYADGNASSLTGDEGDVFMRLPRFYYRATELSEGTGDKWKIEFANYKLGDDCKEWDGNDLIGVYEAYIDNGLMSISGVEPTVNMSQADFKAHAITNRKGYSLVKFKHHSMMAFLFYALYGNTNSQAICGSGTGDYPKTTGQTDTLGMTDTVAGGNGDSGSINFWGLENWWGDIYEWVDNVSINNRVWTITEDDGSTRDVQAGSSDGYISKVSVGESLDMVLTEADASEYTAFCDYYFQLPSDSLVLARSFHGSYTYGGVAYADAGYDASYSNTSFGSRLAFRGVIKEVESSAEFKLIQAI